MNAEEQKAYTLSKEFFHREVPEDDILSLHCALVIEECLAKTENDRVALIIAGWLHDIAKRRDNETHHEAALAYVDEFLELYPEYKDLAQIIKDAVRNHRRTGQPTTEAGKLFQWADKAAVRRAEWQAAKAAR